jgi:hypothetical protein
MKYKNETIQSLVNLYNTYYHSYFIRETKILNYIMNCIKLIKYFRTRKL